MLEGEKTFTKDEQMSHTSFEIMWGLILKVLCEIKIKTIVKFFEKCDISNNLDGIENDHLCAESDNDLEVD